jgi:hypothetical protein
MMDWTEYKELIKEMLFFWFAVFIPSTVVVLLTFLIAIAIFDFLLGV